MLSKQSWLATTALVISAIGSYGTAQARDISVTPDGQANGDGTKTHPLDFATALTDAEKVKAGDTVWLTAGIYIGPFTQSAKVYGTETAPIVYRAVPDARVTIKGKLSVRANYTWFQNLEVTSDVPDPARGDAVNVAGGDGIKLIDLVIHDNPNLNGIGGWDVGNDQEFYGCLSYNNGEKVHAQSHGTYTQNTEKHTVKTFRDCLFFNNFGYGVHCYGQEPELANFLFDGVVAYGNGMGGAAPTINFLVGGYKKADNMTVRDCCTYFPALGSYKRGADFGYNSPENGTLTVENSLFIGGREAVWVKNWMNVTFKGNTCFTPRHQALIVVPPAGFDATQSNVDNNTYYIGTGEPLQYAGKNYADLNAWTQATGWDKDSRLFPGAPQETMLRFRPNKYETNRAYLTIYNWSKTATVPIDLGKLWGLKPGDHYAFRGVEDIWAAPAAEGIYNGGAVQLNMAGKFAPEFACFLITKK